jgi:hypothetical protein
MASLTAQASLWCDAGDRNGAARYGGSIMVHGMVHGSSALSEGTQQKLDEPIEFDATRWDVPAQQLATGLMHLGERLCPSDREWPAFTAAGLLARP